MDILEIFRQAIKGGGDRLGQQFSPVSDEERRANMNQRPNFPGYSTTAGSDARPPYGYGGGGVAAQFAPGLDYRSQWPQQVGTQREMTRRDWSNNPHTRTDFGPEMPLMGRQISAEEFGLADQFAPQGARPNGFPGVDDMQRHRGTGYTVPDAARRHIMGAHDAGRDYGYEGSDPYPPDVVDRVLIEEQMRRRNRTMPGSPVNY